eukprot:g30235.t1
MVLANHFEVTLWMSQGVLFTGFWKQSGPSARRRALRGNLAHNAEPAQAPELPPFQRFPDDYNPDPLDRVVEWFMTLDPDSNQNLETGFTIIVLGITLLSAKDKRNCGGMWETYEKYLRDKEEEDRIRNQKIRRALNPDGWREELFKEEQEAKLKAEQQDPKRGVKDVLAEIYGTDGLEDQFGARLRPGGAKGAKAAGQELSVSAVRGIDFSH